MIVETGIARDAARRRLDRAIDNLQCARLQLEKGQVEMRRSGVVREDEEIELAASTIGVVDGAIRLLRQVRRERT